MTPPPPSCGALIAEAYVYLLKSSKDGRFYLGWTTDMKRRLDAHNGGLVKSTSYRRPFELVYYECHPSAEIAKDRERKLKHNPRMYSLFKKRALGCISIPASMTPPLPADKIGGGVKEVVG